MKLNKPATRLWMWTLTWLLLWIFRYKWVPNN